MQLVYLLAVLFVVVVLNWRLLGLDKVFGRGPGFSWGSPCRWKRDPTHKGADLQRFVCARCGVDGFTTDGRPPRQCKRALRSTGL